MLTSHMCQNHKILMIVDSDADGYTSSAVLINYLHNLFPYYVENYISYQMHEGKQHGIILDKLPKDDDIKLIICADSSSNDYEQHKVLKEAGIDVLVIDHHEAEKVSEYACVINNQLCDYPTKSLSGVGMVYKFCSYMDSFFKEEQKYAHKLLDLVALGEIADVMDLRDFETKRIIEKGIDNIINPYFKAMVEKNAYSLGSEITPIGVAFYVAPYINATIRMGNQDEKMLLFESMLNFKAYELIDSTKRGCKGQKETRVEQACRNCTNIKNKQTKNRDLGLSIIEHLITENNLLDNKILVVPIPKEYEIDKNLTGLIANILMGEYQRPVLLLNSTYHEEDNSYWWEGSARGCNNSKLEDFKELSNEIFEVIGYDGGYAQGHANAFGFGIKADLLEDFIVLSNQILDGCDFSTTYKVDFIFQQNDYEASDILDIANLKHLWGQGMEEPYIVLKNIYITPQNITLMSPDKKPTLKISLPNGISCIKFKSSQEEFENLLPNQGCIIIDLIGRCEKNEWGGNITPQILIEDYEITSIKKYYF